MPDFTDSVIRSKLPTPHNRYGLKTQLSLTLIGILLFIGVVGAVTGPLSIDLRESGQWFLPISLAMLSGVLSVVVAIMFIIWFTSRLIKPLERLSQTASQNARGDLGARAKIDSPNEIGLLERSFNQMADQLAEKIKLLEQAVKLKDEFIAISAHNLKTPLVVMEGYLERLRDDHHAVSNQHRHDLIELDKQVKHLKQITHELLSIVELQNEIFALDLQTHDLVSTASEVISEFSQQVKQKGLTLTSEFATPRIMARFDPHYMTIIWENLISNAIKFTAPGGTVTVKVHETGRQVVGEVLDTGIGFPPSEQKNIFLPFHRVQNVLDANYEGLGLGLYIVKLILDKHGGKIKVDAGLDRGTRVQFTLPK